MNKIYIPAIVVIVLINLCLFPYSVVGEQRDNHAEVKAAIKGAVENCQWWLARDKTELRSVLEQYYTGELLELYTDQLGNIIGIDMGWHWVIELVETEIIYHNDEVVWAKTALAEKNELTGEKLPFNAIYILRCMDDGWRIAGVEYYWN